MRLGWGKAVRRLERHVTCQEKEMGKGNKQKYHKQKCNKKWNDMYHDLYLSYMLMISRKNACLHIKEVNFLVNKIAGIYNIIGKL